MWTNIVVDLLFNCFFKQLPRQRLNPLSQKYRKKFEENSLSWICPRHTGLALSHSVMIYFKSNVGNIKSVWLAGIQTAWLAGWLAGWLTSDWLTGWLLIGWLTGLLTSWLNDWLTDWLADWLTGWLTYWLTGWLTDWLAGWSASLFQLEPAVAQQPKTGFFWD